MSFKTPILLLVFNRPDSTRQVFERIKAMKPTQLFVAADGARKEVEGETEICISVRRIVIDHIDWPCETKTLFRDENLGCGKAVSGAISWFFNEVEHGIILEDDCLPDASFFPFCEELLERYKSDERIAHISGNNYQFGRRHGRADYYFSRYPHIWGWASWRRAWRNFKLEINDSDYALMSQQFSDLFPIKWLDAIRSGKMDTWDTQWVIHVFLENKMSILPNRNLVENIGFNNSGTHTRNTIPFYVLGNPAGSLRFPLRHPTKIQLNQAADRLTAAAIFKLNQSLFDRLYFKYIKTFKLR